MLAGFKVSSDWPTGATLRSRGVVVISYFGYNRITSLGMPKSHRTLSRWLLALPVHCPVQPPIEANQMSVVAEASAGAVEMTARQRWDTLVHGTIYLTIVKCTLTYNTTYLNTQANSILCDIVVPLSDQILFASHCTWKRRLSTPVRSNPRLVTQQPNCKTWGGQFMIQTSVLPLHRLRHNLYGTLLCAQCAALLILFPGPLCVLLDMM